jgi:serine/threonine-protein kinase
VVKLSYFAEELKTMPANLSQSNEDDALDLILPQDIVVGDSYRIKGLLGSGGMGNVYRAEHIILGKDFALKMLAPKLITEENWKRFEAEGKAISKFDHDNIVKIFNMGVDKTGIPYYVMEVLDGFSLRDLIKRQHSPDLNTLLNIFIQVASALQHAHSKGVIHRDVKPSNIMLIESKLIANQAGNATVKYHAMLLDFGIAKVLNVTGLERQRLTATGQVFGTPYYMSPEQCVGDILDCQPTYTASAALYSKPYAQDHHLKANLQ